MKIGFDNDKYLAMQSAHIRERIAQFDNKLYLEFGGKLFDDYHASRVLPGFQPDSKLQMLLQLKDQAEIVVVISAEDAPMLTSSRKSLAAFSFLSQTPAQADILVQDGDTVTLGNTVFTVLATPGHTPGGVCYITEHCIFSGDTLFFCSCGRTDFPGGSSREIMDSLQKLAALPGDYTVYPGHDRFSTLNFERQHNPYMKKL